MGLPGYQLSAGASAAEARYASSRGAKSTGEGEFREGPFHLPITGGWLGAGAPLNFWQMGGDVSTGASSAIVQACVSAYAQTTAMCPGAHWRARADGGRDRVTNSALSRVLQKPNAYQSPSDFLLNLVSRLYRSGNAYAVAIRNSRFEIVELHLTQDGHARVAEDGSIFYWLTGNEVIERQTGARALAGVPARDVLHVRLETPRHPLLGETPMMAALLDLAASNALARQAVAYFDRQSRPSGILSTEQILKKEQADDLRERWNEQAKGLNAGGVPILSGGLKWVPMGSSAKDSQAAEIMKMGQENVAMTFRTPLQILGIGDAKFSSTELLMASWLASGLGFCVNHVEQAYDRLFGNAGFPNEYCELDTSVLLRSDFKTRVEGWVAGVGGGIFARDEARADFEFGKTPGGHEPWVQMQDLPLSEAARRAKEPPAAPPPPAPTAADIAAQQRALAAQFEKHLREALDA